jgi:N utilization substance protein B
MARKTARQVAMQLIYQYELGGEGVSSTIEESMDKPDLNQEDMAYIQAMIDGTAQKADLLDEKIAKYAVGWTLERIAKVDLSILRLALFEMLFRDDIPEGVSINEAIELAHTFSTPEAASFINGILGSVSRAPKEEV